MRTPLRLAALVLLSAAPAAAAPSILTQQEPASVALERDERKLTPDAERRLIYFPYLEPRAGSDAPDFDLKNLDGERIRLAGFRGKKPVVLVFGSASCFVFRRNFPRVAETLRPFAGRVELLAVYTLEAHPALGDRCPYSAGPWVDGKNVADRVLVRQPRDAAERLRVARAFAQRLKLDARRVLIDDFDDSVWKAYGAWSAGLYVVDANGRVVFKERWAGESSFRGEPEVLHAVRSLVGE